MKASSIIYAHEVVRRLSDNEDLEESVLRDSSGADVAYRIRSGEVIAIWDVATKHLRIYSNDARPLAGLTGFESGSRAKAKEECPFVSQGMTTPTTWCRRERT